MKHKKAHYKDSRKRAVLRLTAIVIIFTSVVLLLFSYLFTKTQAWYFMRTGKEQVDFSSAGAYDWNSKTAVYAGAIIPVPKPADDVIASRVLGDTTSQKRIEIDLTNQRLYAFNGDTKVYDFPVSTGKWSETPTGEFEIWIKLRYTRMKGGSKALGTFYDLPNVPYTMFVYNAQYPKALGYGIHGAYWHNNFGHPMSHGCINMKTEDVAQLYYWAQPNLNGKTSIQETDENKGTRVVIYGITPKS